MRYGNDKVALSEVESEKDLGIMFDSEMKFQAHINDVCNRGYQRIAVIRRTFYLHGQGHVLAVRF